MQVFAYLCMVASLLWWQTACFAQQPIGPATLESLLQVDEAGKAAAAASDSGAPAKRPVGVVARPKDGVRHPDLDQAWVEYESDVAAATESIKAAIAKQFSVAKAEGDLDGVEKWQAMGERIERAGELPSAHETKAAVRTALARYRKAGEELTKAYGVVVSNLTKQKRIAEARACREESLALAAAVGLGGPENQSGKRPKNHQTTVFLSDLQERDIVVGHGAFGKAGDLGWEGQSITVGGVASKKGISMHPPSRGASRATFTTPANAIYFEGFVAINDTATQQETPLTFKVLGDGRLLWTSRPVKGRGASERVRVPTTGVSEITLVVECPGDYAYAHAVWFDPYFVTR